MKTSKLTFILLLCLSLFACKDEDEPAPTNPYIGCCNIPAVEISLGNSKLNIPNAFTPNDDGINDVFTVQSTNIDFIPRFEIFDKNEKSVFRIINGSVFQGHLMWDGTIDHFGNDVVVGGKYSYELEFFTFEGMQSEVSGTICCYICDEDLPVGEDDCLFFTQLKFNGTGFDPDMDNQESDCIQ